MSFAIEVSDLTKHYGSQCVVNHLSLKVPKGSIFGFLGPNGSGKTTTIRMISGLVTPDAGSGQCLGYDIAKDAVKIKSKLGYMPQKFSYYPEISVRDNLLFMAQIMGLASPLEQVDLALSTHELIPYADRAAGLLSGGWKQRLSLACALMHDPELLLLDEPTASVDPGSRRAFWEVISALGAQGKTILVSTHLMDETARCTHLAYLLYGNLIACGAPEALISDTGLQTLKLESSDLMALRASLQARFHPMQQAIFGHSLHVTDRDAALLDAIAQAAKQEGIICSWVPVSVEDVFIHFMKQHRR